MGISFAGMMSVAGRWSAVGIIGTACLPACTTTHLAVHQLDPTNPTTRVGAPFPLMYNAYEIKVTRKIVACAKKAEVFFKAEITPLGSRPDPDHNYVLDTNSLANWMKTSEVKVEYHPSGTVKGLNASADDKTGAVIASTASLLSKIALAGVPPGAGAPAQSFCSPAVARALANIVALNTKVSAAEGVVNSLVDEIKKLMTKVDTVGGQTDSTTRKNLSKQYNALQQAQQTLDTHANDLARQLKVVTEVDRIEWPRDGNSFKYTHSIDSATRARWLADPREANGKDFNVAFAIDSTSKGSHVRSDASRQQVTVANGVPYRPPVSGVVRVCTGDACPALDADKAVQVSHLDQPILQLGHVYYLDCTSRPFSSIGCSFEMTESGQLQSIGTAHKAALAEGAIAAAARVADQYAATRAARDSAAQKRAEANLAVRTAESELLAIERSLLPDDVADRTKVLQADAELAKAEKAKLDAEEALRVARLAATGSTG